MKNLWTNKELKLLSRWDEIRNDFYPEIMGPFHEEEEEFHAVEGQLRIINKDFIVYMNNEAIGIYSFTEYLDLEFQYNAKGEILSYHPVNFKSLKAYVIYPKIQI